MEELYRKMVAKLKVAYNDLQVLHHYVTGNSFFGVHEAVGELYDKVGDMIDDLVEIGMSVGIHEIGIKDSVLMFEPLPIIGRDCNETARSVIAVCEGLIAVMDECKDSIPYGDIANKIEEYQYYLRKEANYKFAMLLVPTMTGETVANA